VARYYTATGQKPSKEALDFWRRAMCESLLGRDWATLGWFWGKYALRYPAAPDFAHPDYRHDYWQYTPRAIHRDAAGLIGYLRLCRLAGETGEAEAWGQLARLLTFRFALVRYLESVGLTFTYYAGSKASGTLLRNLVVSTVVALFILAGLLWRTNRRSASPFLYWYPKTQCAHLDRHYHDLRRSQATRTATNRSGQADWRGAPDSSRRRPRPLPQKSRRLPRP
jgi:hypothetical protein